VHDDEHLPTFFVNGVDYLKMFMQNPLQEMVASKVVVE
jgi:hypothetical protein